MNKRFLLSIAGAALLASLFSPAAAEAAPLQGHISESSLTVDSFPDTIQGTWQCLTVVTDSQLDTVQVGERMGSQMSFVKGSDGKVLARFQQRGWTEAQESVTELSPSIYQMDKINCFHNGDSTNWTARSRDRYQLIDGNTMLAVSAVDQYTDGKYVGTYYTSSTLIKMNQASTNVAASQTLQSRS